MHGQVRRLLSLTGLTENGLRISAGEVGAFAAVEDMVLDQAFSVTLTDGRSARLRRAGVAAKSDRALRERTGR